MNDDNFMKELLLSIYKECEKESFREMVDNIACRSCKTNSKNGSTPCDKAGECTQTDEEAIELYYQEIKRRVK